jgi:tRNA threonylcarbamoyl adenosine modification protein (Sua5/YciO/YrdC/YwlC family)
VARTIEVGADIEAAVASAAAVLRDGKLVVLPTDTVYGLAALPSSPDATRALFEAKGRGAGVPVAVLCSDLDQAKTLVDDAAHELLTRVAVRLWPGALTLVLPRRQGLTIELGEPRTTIGVRCPDDELVRALARTVGPLATTSANRHGEPTPATATEAAAQLGRHVALVLDGGARRGGSSTVVDLTRPTPTVLREGPVTAQDVEAAAAEAG